MTEPRIVTASREGGASLTILSGLVAGNFSAFWKGMLIAGLMFKNMGEPNDRIARWTTFLAAEDLFPRFGLPMTLPAG